MGGFVNQTATPRQVFGRRTAPPPSAGLFAPTPSPPPKAGPVRQVDTQAVIARSFSLMAHNAVTFLALIAAAAAPERIVYHLFDSGSFALMPLYFGITALTCVPLYTAIFIGAMQTLTGQKATFKTCFRAGMRQSRPAALLSLMTALLVWLLLVVPGLSLAIRWAVAAPAAIVEDKGLRAAMARSAALTAPYRPQVAVLILLLAATAVSRAVPMLSIWHVPAEGILFFMFRNWLFPLLLTAFTAAASASLYYELCMAAKAQNQLPPLVITG